jgi:hypothetical protein
LWEPGKHTVTSFYVICGQTVEENVFLSSCCMWSYFNIAVSLPNVAGRKLAILVSIVRPRNR